MYKPSKKLIPFLVVALLFNAGANANSLNDMFMSNVTAGQPIKGNQTGYFGGSAIIRTPVVGISLGNFQPPHMTAGCSGADLFMGSFSFISADQIVATLKAIMNNATGLLFQAAIEFISPMISGLMTKFEQISRAMNNSRMNSCQIATAAVAGAGSLMGFDQNHGPQKVGANLATSGMASDWGKVFNEPFSIGASSVAAAAKLDSTSGNNTWKALVNVNAGAQVNLPIFNPPTTNPADPATTLFNNEILMSFLGYRISDPTGAGQPNGGAGKSWKDGDPPGAPGSPVTNAAASSDKATLTFNKILDSTGKETYFLCASGDPDCMSLTTPNLHYVAATTWVRVMLLGDPTWMTSTATTESLKANLADQDLMKSVIGASTVAIAPNSIAGIFGGATSATSLTVSQQQFLNMIRGPILNLLTSLKGGEYSQVAELSRMLEDYIALEVTVSMADSILNSYSHMTVSHNSAAGGAGPSTGGQTTMAELGPDVELALVNLKKERNELYGRFRDSSDSFNKAQQFVKNAIEARDRKNILPAK